MHNLMSQLAVGIFAFGVRHLIKKRKEAKRQAQTEAAAAPPMRVTGVSMPQGAVVDQQLSAALDTVAKEVQGASESIRRLAHSAPSHRNCGVRETLVADADKLQGSLGSLQASINNMRNLHPGLEQGRVKPAAERRRRRRRTEGRERTEGRDRIGRERTGEKEGTEERGRADEARGEREPSRRHHERRDRHRERAEEASSEKELSRRDRDRPLERPRSRLSRRDWDDELRRGRPRDTAGAGLVQP
jgi:hypothetical protein